MRREIVLLAVDHPVRPSENKAFVEERVECTITGAFVLLAAAGVTGPAWLLVLGYTGHGLKDFWQERSHYVAGTRWWPPFCAAVDCLVAVILAIEVIAGAGFHH